MKLIVGIIRPERVNQVRRALEELQYPGLTLSDVRGHGRQKGLSQQWRGREYVVDMLPKVRIEILASDDEAPALVQAIVESARTGDIGDGKIFVLPVQEVVRIRTGDRGDEAV